VESGRSSGERGIQGGQSPDRADAMVWAMTELFEQERAAPRVTVL
jgi:phage terminase large subunit-like protein